MRFLNFAKHYLFAVSILGTVVACSQENGIDNIAIQADAYLEVADLYREQGQFRSSLIEVQNALQLVPQNERALLLQAQLMMDIGDYDQAETYLSSMLTAFPDRENTALLLAETLVSLRQAQRALEVTEGLDGSTQEFLLQLNWVRGMALASQEEYASSRAAFNQALEIDNQHIDSLIGLSKVAYMEQQLDSAREYLTSAQEIDPENLDLQIWEGDFAVLTGNYPEAEAAYFDALQIMGTYDTMTNKRFRTLNSILIPLQMQQKNDEAMQYAQIIADTPQGQVNNAYANALMLFERQDFEQAAEVIQNTLTMAPNNAESNILLGLTRYQLGDYAAAEASLSQYVEMSTASPQSIKVLAASHIQMGNHQQALTILTEALDRFPQDGSIYALIGHAQRMQGDLNNAVISFAEAVKLLPETADVRVNAAEVYALAGQYDSAIDELEAASTLSPDNKSAKTNLVRLLIEQNRPSEARNQVETWISEQPDSVLNHNIAGILALNLENYEEALSHFERSTAIDSSDYEARLFLARIALDSGNYQRAESELEETLNRDPTNAEALSGLLQLGVADGSVDQRISYVQQIIDDYPYASSPPMVLSQFQIGRGNDNEGVELARLAYSREVSEVTRGYLITVLAQLSDNVVQEQQFDQAQEYISEALELQRNNVDLLSRAAVIEGRLGEFENAFAYVDLIKSEVPGSVRGILAEADIHILQGDMVSAAVVLREAWATEKASEIARSLYQVLVSQEFQNEARSFVTEWLNTLPQDPYANLANGVFLMGDGQDEQAITHYEVALESIPNNIIVLNNLAWLYQDRDPDRAVELASQAAQLSPQNANILDTYGWVLFKQGELERAREILTRAQSLDPDSEMIAEHLEQISQ